MADELDKVFNKLKYPAIIFWEEEDSEGHVWYCAQYPDGHVEEMVYYAWLVEDAELHKCRLIFRDEGKD